jgi:catechol-2,3-dioxygenase
MQIIEVNLLTSDLDRQRDFYTGLLEVPALETGGEELVLQVGRSCLRFTPGPPGWRGAYHFAFDIPEHQFDQAKAWLAERAPLIADGAGMDEFDFRNWNAHATYCYDPAGNVLELIARHDRPSAARQPFDGRSFLSISEIGLATDDLDGLLELLRDQLGAEVYRGSHSAEFAAMGDGHGLLILVKRGRVWFPETGVAADAYPVSVVVSGPRGETYRISGPPYKMDPGSDQP